jgi:carbon storage regulator
MLVLTRRQEESIKIGIDIEIKVLEIKKNAVRIGIIAPRDVSVHRREVYDLIQKENLLASRSSKIKGALLEKLIKGNKPSRNG